MGIYIPDKLIEELRNNPMDAWDLLEHDDAVTVKAPHGRLIDADFEEKHYTSMTTTPTPDVSQKDKDKSLVIVRALQMARTVIEAEVE